MIDISEHILYTLFNRDVNLSVVNHYDRSPMSASVTSFHGGINQAAKGCPR